MISSGEKSRRWQNGSFMVIPSPMTFQRFDNTDGTGIPVKTQLFYDHSKNNFHGKYQTLAADNQNRLQK